MNRQFHGRVAMLGLALALAGCASPGAAGPEAMSGITTSRTDAEVRTQAPPPSRLEFPKISPDSLWKLVPKAFDYLGIKAGVLPTGTRVYGNYAIVMSSITGDPVRPMFRCSNETGPSTTAQYRIEFDIAASPVMRSAGGSELVVQIRATGASMDASRSGKIDCLSNGNIEKKLKAQLESLMRG
jgi:hypothetical protein